MDRVRVRAWLGTAGFLVLAPGVVAGLMPGLLTGWRFPWTRGRAVAAMVGRTLLRAPGPRVASASPREDGDDAADGHRHLLDDGHRGFDASPAGARSALRGRARGASRDHPGCGGGRGRRRGGHRG